MNTKVRKGTQKKTDNNRKRSQKYKQDDITSSSCVVHGV